MLTVTLHTPRLLPLTMLVGAMLLATKSILLLHEALPGVPPLPVNGDVLSAARAAPTAVSAGGPGIVPGSGSPAGAADVALSEVGANAASTGASTQAAARRPGGGGPAAEAYPGAVREPPHPPPPVAASAPITASPMPEITEGERAVLLDLRKRRAELDAREQRDTEREAMMAAAEKRLADRVRELQGLQTRLEALDAQRASREDANWRGLAKMYEAMRPRDAAAIFNDLEMAVLLPVLNRMAERKAAAVLAAMQPDRARLATAQLAALRERETTPADPKQTADTQPGYIQPGTGQGAASGQPLGSGS